MSNLAQAIRDDVRVELVFNMHRNGFTIEQIALAINKNVEEVQAIIEKGQPVLA